MNILIISGLFDINPSSGGGLLMKQYVDELLAQGHEVTVCYETSNEGDLAARQDARFIYLPEVKDQFFAKKNLLAKAANKLKSKLAPQTLYRKRDFSYCEPLAKQLIKEKSIDVVQVDFPWMMPVIEVLPENVLRVFVSHELRSRREDNVQRKDFDLMREEELEYISKYDAVLTLTPVEKEYITQHMPRLTCYESTMGVYKETGSKFSPSLAAEKIVFLGSGNHLPNLDAIEYLCTEIWPILLKELPEARLNITGNYQDDFKDKFSAVPGIEWVGFVPDLDDFMRNTISVVPVRLGSGIRIKILDSMRMGAPVVSTPMAAEGIACTDGKDILLGADADEFAAQVISLWRDPERYKNMSEAGRALVQQKYELHQTTAERVKLFDELRQTKQR